MAKTYNLKGKEAKEFVTETQDIFKKYSKDRDTWAQHAQEDREFRLGKQWSASQKKTLEARGQAPIVVNRVHPAVETAKAMLTANRPSFRCSPREDSDNKMAQVISGMLEYMWDISDGANIVRNVVDDYYVTGLGCMLVYQDPMADDGKGEVKIRDIDPLDVYIDPNSRDRFCDDAENIVISRLFTKEQAIKMYPMYKKAIRNATGEFASDRPMTTRRDEGQTSFPEEIRTQDDDYIRGYERYMKVQQDMFRVFEGFSGFEHVFEKEEFEGYIQQQIALVNGQPMQDMQIVQQMSQQGAQVEMVTYEMLIGMGMIQVAEVTLPRIKQCVIIGDSYLYSRILPFEQYPIVMFMNLHTRTPYPMSDVRIIKPLQEYINKTRSLIIAHATTSTNTKILIPEGSVDMGEFEEKWAQPGVAIPFDPTDGAPMPVQPTPLPNELYKNEADAKADIDHALGLYEMMMGNSQAAPQTYKATVSLDEFGQRKIKSKLSDIEAGLKRVGEVAIPMMQQLYRTEKIFRVLQPNNSLSEYVVNKRLYDDKTKEISIFNNLAVGKYDVIVVTGSTLPTNRYAQLELYMDAYKNGIIDKQEVLKKTEVFDMEGVLQRTDLIAQLQQQLEGAQEQIKKLEGDLQSRDRESGNLRKRVEVEKFKADLDKKSNKVDAAGTIFEKRLDDTLGSVKKEIRDAIQKNSKPPNRATKEK